MGCILNVNIAGSTLQSAPALLDFMYVGETVSTTSTNHQNMVCYDVPKGPKHANLLMRWYQNLSGQMSNIYHQSSIHEEEGLGALIV